MELLIVIVVIGILASIVIVSYRGIVDSARSSAMTSDLLNWKRVAETYKIQHSIECPAGYVFVYGNSTLGTSDFCVMKYEAKNDGSGNAVSTASGPPWASITQTAAIAAASATGGHLITEAEWMTIAADVLSVKYNWSGGEVGSGYIYQGHVNGLPGGASAASTDDSDRLNSIAGGTGTTVGTNSSRVLYLKSGDAIWDLSGNVAEWTQQAVGTPTLTISQIGVSGDSGFIWREWTLGSLNLGNLPALSMPGMLAPIGGLSGVASWNAAQGVGRVYANYAAVGDRAFLRGEYWSSTSDAGVLALRLYAGPSTVSSGFGFRVAR